MIIREKINIAGHYISDKTRHNLVYFLYFLYELRYGKVLLNNCGYYPSDIADDNACQLQLYIELMKAADINTNESIALCELGCGQGHGGIYLLKNYFNSDSQFTGLDISQLAIAYCKFKYRAIKNAVFKVNTKKGKIAEDNSFDVIISVETSVPRYDDNLIEIYHCLKPSGLLIFFETYNMQDSYDVDAQLKEHGFDIIKKINVTENIVQAFSKDNDRKVKQLFKLKFLSPKLAKFLSDYMGTIGSVRFENYAQNKRNGFIYALRKRTELLIGYLERFDGQYLHGWACCLNSNEAININVYVNDTLIAECVANIARADVADIYGQEYLNSGFVIALNLDRSTQNYIRVTHSKTGQIIKNTLVL